MQGTMVWITVATPYLLSPLSDFSTTHKLFKYRGMPHPIALVSPRNLKYLTENLQSLIAGRLWLKVVIGMLAGIIVGYLFNPEVGIFASTTSEIVASWVALPGKFFLIMVQMIVVPLVFASLIRGIAANNSIGQLKSTGLKLFIYLIITTSTAILIGIWLAHLLQPGTFVDISTAENSPIAAEMQANIERAEPTDLSLSTLPSAIINVLPNNPLSDVVEANMLQIVLFSIIIGLALVSMNPTQSKPLLDLMGSILEVSMTIVRWVMAIAPYAVFGLIAQLVIETGLDAFVGIGAFVVTVLIGLGILMLLYLALAWLFGGWKPWIFIEHIRETQLLAFSTDSSAATMPLSLKTVQEKLKVRPSIAQFVIPIGATVNMNATALFQGIATIFFTQAYGLDLSTGAIIALIVTIIGASIGAPATPGVGIVVLAVVLRGAGIPLEGLALIIGVDQILERLRAMLNVTGDLVASVVINRLAPEEKIPTYEQEVVQEHKFEKQRRSTGEDVIIHPSPEVRAA